MWEMLDVSSQRVSSPLCQYRQPPRATTSASGQTTRGCSSYRCSLPGFAAAAAVAVRAEASLANRQRPDQRPFDRSVEAASDIAVGAAEAVAPVAAVVAQVAPRDSSRERICRIR